MKARGGEGQNGRLKCPMGFLVLNKTAFFYFSFDRLQNGDKKAFDYVLFYVACMKNFRFPLFWIIPSFE